MHKKIFSLLVLVCFFSQVSFAQNAAAPEAEDRSAEFKEAAAEILGEASGMVGSLASPENRLSYTIRIAGLAWPLDETQARAMFQYAVEELKREIMQTDAALNRMANQPETEWANSGSFADARNRSNRIFQMRSTLLNTIADRDAEWAMRVLSETGAIVSNPELAKRFEQSDAALKNSIAGKAARQNVDDALALGRERLAKGVSYDVTSLLQQIYNKDQAKGIEFGKEIVDKIKSSKDTASSWIVLSLLRQGSTNLQTLSKNTAAGQKPIFDELTMRDLAEILADSMIKQSSRRTNAQAMQYIEKYAPQKVALVSRAAEARASQNNQRRAATTGAGGGANNNRRAQTSSWQKINEARSNAQKEISESMQGLEAENLSDEEKVRIINETRAKILAVNNDAFRSSNLLNLAGQARRTGQTELAEALIGDAERFVNLQPKERREFTENRNLANAYAAVNPDKSFAILENMIYRLNDVIESFVKVGEFSGNGRMVDSGEMLMNNSSRQFTGYIFLSGDSLESLAEADLARLKNLGDKFTRPEFRIETRLVIAQNLLNPGSAREPRNPRMRGFGRMAGN